MSSGSMLIPSVRYKDAHAAMDWLEKVLGLVRHVVIDGPDGTVAHAQMTFVGTGMIMLGSASNPSPHPHLWGTPETTGGKVTSPMYLVVADCEPLWANVQTANAEILQSLETMDYGGKAFTVRDPEGYVWSVGEYDPWAVHGE
jgi:uncharacterized glyoxalase superfamily protein PhnB